MFLLLTGKPPSFIIISIYFLALDRQFNIIVQFFFFFFLLKVDQCVGTAQYLSFFFWNSKMTFFKKIYIFRRMRIALKLVCGMEEWFIGNGAEY